MKDAYFPFSDAGRAQRRDEWEWEYICATTVGKLAPDELQSLLEFSTIRPNPEGHAYSSTELRELSSILRMHIDKNSGFTELRRESDKFACIMGSCVKRERHLTGKARMRDIQTKFINPAQALLDILSDADFTKEFSLPWRGGGFDDFDYIKFRNDESKRSCRH
jgi:hypothetical protein